MAILEILVVGIVATACLDIGQQIYRLATGMPIAYAIGTSLVAVAVFGATTAANYALSGMVDWRIAAMFVGGGIVGGLLGTWAGSRLAGRKGLLSTIFAGFVILIGIYVSWKGLSTLFG